MPPTKDEIFEKVQGCLVDALGVDEDEVTTEATLVGDLGAESIDFLDIVFRLEHLGTLLKTVQVLPPFIDMSVSKGSEVRILFLCLPVYITFVYHFLCRQFSAGRFRSPGSGS